MRVHDYHKNGLIEAVYRESLSLELIDKGIENEEEKEIHCYYRQHQLKKKYRMDIVVGDIVVELKAVRELLPEHRAQLCNYLRLTRKPLGLLINFGAPSIQGERWAFDVETNECYVVDVNMQPVSMDDIDIDYEWEDIPEVSENQNKLMLN